MNSHLIKRNILSRTAVLICVIILNATGLLMASDLSDATEMRKKCEEEYKGLEISVNNFGNSYVKRKYEQAGGMLKDGKLCLAQSKYKEAIDIYKKYMTQNTDIYRDLSIDYIKRAEAMYNETAAELVDYYDNDKVSQYFRLAKQNIDDAKKASANNNYKLAIDLAKISKKYSIESYNVAGKPVPDKYRIDISDNNKVLYTEGK